jgi:tRNA(Ile)-lysidine synthase
MKKFLPFSPQGLALAVSGGPDSVALALCAKAWATSQHIPLRAFIVDHALRDVSASEAAVTQKQLEKLGIPADILRWEHPPIISRIHITARKARHKLLLDACRRYGVRDLLLAHHRDDQAETILMRFAKGSGIDGLAGISPETQRDGIRLLRPLLAFPKERLIATCILANVSYVTDSSNASEKYARGRLRRVLPLLAEEGLTTERLYELGARAAEARDALNHYTNVFLQTSVRQDDAGVVRMDIAALRTLPRAIAERAVTWALQNIHREDYAPEYTSLTGLLDVVCAAENMTPRTLHGCLVSATKTQLLFMREYAAIIDAPVIKAGETLVWDGRWQVTLSADAWGSYKIKPLGNPPHDVLDQLAPSLRHKVPQGRARSTLPALWTIDKNAENLALIPSLTSSDSPNQTHAELLAFEASGQ